MYSLRVETEFAAAHFLSHYHGKCENLHGHNYKVRFWVRGNDLNEGGMLADFSLLKKALNDCIAPLDHSNLNDMEIFQNDPSAERIAKYIFEESYKKLTEYGIDKSLLWAVDVFENSRSMARYENSRSVPKQIEHWAKIGRIAEDNPDLPYEFIKSVLEAKNEMDNGEISEFEFKNN